MRINHLRFHSQLPCISSHPNRVSIFSMPTVNRLSSVSLRAVAMVAAERTGWASPPENTYWNRLETATAHRHVEVFSSAVAAGRAQDFQARTVHGKSHAEPHWALGAVGNSRWQRNRARRSNGTCAEESLSSWSSQSSATDRMRRRCFRGQLLTVKFP